MTAWIVQTLVASTLLMLAIAAARPLLRERVGPRLMYALWSLPALRMVLPPLPLLEAEAAPASLPVAAPSIASAGFEPSTIVLGVWLAGAALWLAWQVGRYRHFVRSSRAGGIGEAIRLGGIRVRRCGAVEGPVAAGVWRREIFLPLDFVRRFDAQERRLALVHELMHHRRHDLLANLVALVVLALHWFNPIAHRAYALFRADQELACDADVLKHVGQGQGAAYGRALLKASRGAPAALCCLSETALLKQRLRGLASGSPAGAGMTLLAMLAAIPMLALSAVTRGAAEPFPVTPRTIVDNAAAPTVIEPALTPAMPISPSTPRASTPRQATFDSAPTPMIEPQRQRRSDSERDGNRHASPAEAAAARGRPVGDLAYLAQRRALGLARARARRAVPAEAGTQGHPLADPPPTG